MPAAAQAPGCVVSGENPLRVVRFLDRWLEQIALVVLCSALVLSLTYTVIVRYFLPFPFFTVLSHKAEEIGVFSFVWLLYWGSVLATKEGGHFLVSAQFAILPKSWRRYRYLPGDLVWLALNLVLVWQGTVLVKSSLERPQASLSLQIPMHYVYAVIPLAFLLTCVRLVQSYVRGKRGGEEPVAREL